MSIDVYTGGNGMEIPNGQTLKSIAEAKLDPIFTLDPAYANDFEFIYSPELVRETGDQTDPATPVPIDTLEPKTWALLLGGLGGMAAVSKAKQRRANQK